MDATARRALTVTIVVTAVVVVALALWELRLLIMLLFFAFTVAAAMRPSVEALHRRRIPRGAAILLHYAALAGLLGLLLGSLHPIEMILRAAREPTDSPAHLRLRAFTRSV